MAEHSRGPLAPTFLLLALGILPTLVRAQTPEMADISELAAMFIQLCMNDFPDEAKSEAFLRSNGAIPMAPADVQKYLREDPGRGWYVKTGVTLYAVTFEEPPFHTCAIRRMTQVGAGGDGMKTISEAQKAYAASIGGSIVMLKPSQTRVGPAGPDVTYFGFGIVDAAGKPTDSFGVFLSNYHGRVPEPFVEQGTPGVGVEVRLSRQVVGR